MDAIEEILTRGVENVFPSREELKKVLLSGKKLRIYTGIDPTGNLHIGHGVVLKKLRQFQDLGHDVIVLIGDFTARIGDPTDKMATRKKLTKEQVKENSANYKKLIGKILDLKKSNIRFLHNEEWTNKLKPVDMLELASHFTVSRLLERDMFQKRIKEGKEIHVHEFLYPIFQAYDSVTMDVDMEIGGNDQTFNMLAGRTLMRKIKGKEKFVLATKLLTDPSGVKMGKTEGNMIDLDMEPAEMYSRIMSWPDSLLGIGFEICTNIPHKEASEIKEKINNGEINPRDAKMRLAFEVVKIFHSEKEAKGAQENFVKIFQKKEIPEEMQEILIKKGEMLGDALVANKIVSSKSEFRRLVGEEAIDVNNETISDPKFAPQRDAVVKIGKRKFVKIILK